MKRNTWFALPSVAPPPRVRGTVRVRHRRGACDDGLVDTHTKAFLTGPQLMARAAPSLELAGGETTNVVVSLKLRNAAQLKQLARDVNRPGSAHYRQYLTHEQFLANYAPTDAQVKSVVDYLHKSGFVNVEVAPNRLLVSASGTAATVKTAFNTSLVHFDYAGHSGFANTSTAQVPRALGDVVGSVLGLQNVAHARPLLHIGNVSKPQALAAGTATGHYPKEFPGLYNATGVPTAAGVTVGIITIGGVSQTLQDLKQFTSSNGYGTVSTQTIKTNGSGSYTDDRTARRVGSRQPVDRRLGRRLGKLVFYMADLNASGNTGLTQAFNRAVSDNTAKVINVSLGWCETDANADGTLDAEEQIFTTAAAQGQTFSVSSGDEGVYECNNRGYPDGSNYTVSWPASSPHVLAIGGTTLYTSSSGAFSSETVWNEGRRQRQAVGDGRRRQHDPARAVVAIGQQPPIAGRLVRRRAKHGCVHLQLRPVATDRRHEPRRADLHRPLGAPARSERHGPRLPGRQVLRRHSVEPVARALRRGVGNNGYQGYGYNAGTGWDYTTGFGSLNIANLNQLIKSGGF